MNELSGLFHDIAEDVRGYDVGDSALRVARKRRSVRRAAPIALPILLVALVAIVWVPLHRTDAPSTNPLSWLPSRIAAPDASTPDLPADRGVGLAALVYSPCREECWRVVVLRDGTQYRLATAGSQPVHKLSAALSPDGRWVAYPDARGDLILRDLTGQTAVTFPGMRPRGWSPGGQYLLLVPVSYAGSAPATIVDLSTATAIRTVSLQAYPQGTLTDVAAILDSGELVWVTSEIDPNFDPGVPLAPGRLMVKSSQVKITDPDGREVLRQFALQPPSGSGYLTAPTSAVTATADGKLLVRYTVGYDWGTAAGPADVVDANTGAVGKRYGLPAADGPFDTWIAVGLAGGQLVALHGRSGRAQVTLLDHTNGKPRLVCQIESGFGAPVLPGSTS